MNRSNYQLGLQQDVRQVLIEHRGEFIAVSDIADQLKLSYDQTLDALVGLRDRRLASQTVGGWRA